PHGERAAARKPRQEVLADLVLHGAVRALGGGKGRALERAEGLRERGHQSAGGASTGLSENTGPAPAAPPRPPASLPCSTPSGSAFFRSDSTFTNDELRNSCRGEEMSASGNRFASSGPRSGNSSGRVDVGNGSGHHGFH